MTRIKSIGVVVVVVVVMMKQFYNTVTTYARVFLWVQKYKDALEYF
jgi:hypothetical protein